MAPKKGKVAAKGKGKSKVPQVEPATDGVAEAVQAEVPTSDDAPKAEEPKVEEPKAEDTKAEETKAEESAVEDAPAVEEEPAADAQPEAQPDVDSPVQAEVAPKAEAEHEKAPNGKKTKKRKAANASAAEEEITSEPTSEPAVEEQAAPETKAEEVAEKPSKKRKPDAPKKEVREGSRRSARGTQKAQPSTEQLLNYLLSDAAAEICRPEDEEQDLADSGSGIKSYSSSTLSPFEELICAVILSRPISHKLGMRAIRTVLNEPYNFTTPKALIAAGKEKRHQALVDAKTQHREKTAEQIGLIADVVAHKFGKDDTDTSMDKLRQQASKGWDMERDLLQENIKGIGRTGLDIFFRRVQWLWPEAFPFVDERSARGIEKLGLPKNPDDLARTLDRYWAKLDTSSLTHGDKDTKKRRAFVMICDRAMGADLEGKSEAIIEAAALS